MGWEDVPAVAISMLAVLVSLWSLVYARYWGQKINPIQKELKTLQLEQAKSARAASVRANVRASLSGSRGRDKLVVENHGPSTANDVDIDFDFGGKGNPIIESELSDKLPIRVLGSGAEVNLIAAPASGDAMSFSVRVTWRDDGGENSWESDLSFK